mmetsp:Transcript_13709/g.38801  ORF Transcript_13709/g.38801 Transcript_13709/m.38801 type:complete len:293 (+) Transcript_13709:874-1752(+)
MEGWRGRRARKCSGSTGQATASWAQGATVQGSSWSAPPSSSLGSPPLLAGPPLYRPGGGWRRVCRGLRGAAVRRTPRSCCSCRGPQARAETSGLGTPPGALSTPCCAPGKCTACRGPSPGPSRCPPRLALWATARTTGTPPGGLSSWRRPTGCTTRIFMTPSRPHVPSCGSVCRLPILGPAREKNGLSCSRPTTAARTTTSGWCSTLTPFLQAALLGSSGYLSSYLPLSRLPTSALCSSSKDSGRPSTCPTLSGYTTCQATHQTRTSTGRVLGLRYLPGSTAAWRGSTPSCG